MAFPSSPEVGLEDSSGLDHLIKNTEFENIQHTKAIETERERIKAYKCQLEERKQHTVELEKSTVVLDEQTMKLHKQFSFNQENYESLKHTSTVLGDHEDTLRKKVSILQTNVEQEYSEQSNALSKYEGIWASYQAKYESKEKVKLLRSKEEMLHTVQEHNAQLEKTIEELEQTIHTMKQNHGMNINSSLVSWVLQIATLRCETNHHLQSICAEIALAGTLRLEIGGLEAKTLEIQSLLEKREMEAKLAIQQQTETEQRVDVDDVAAMETNDSYASAVSKDFQAPNFENPPGVMTSAGFIQTPLSLQPPNTTANLPTQEAGSNATTPRGQQKKASRFLLEMPQLSMPRPRPVTNTTPANPRAQVTITRPTSLSQVVASTNQRRVAQLQMPSLHTPSRPKLPTTSTIHHTAIGSTSSHIYNTSLTVSKPSLQISKPAQVELTRPMTHQATNKNITETQQGSNAMLCMPQLQQQQTGSPSTEMVENEVASQQNGVTDSNATATDMPQEMQAGDKNNASDMHQDASNVSNINKEGESLNGDDIMGTSRGEESSVFNAADVQIQQPLTSTAPAQQAITTSMIALNTNTASMIEANAMEMADPSITSYSGPTFTGFNEAPQQMDTTNSDSNSSQDPAATAEGVYSMYGAEMYQQPNPQMQMGNTMGGEFYDRGMSEFGQSDGFSGGIFGGAGFSSFGGGSFFGGSPATPQQQQSDSGGFGFSFGGGSTPTSSGSIFSFF